MTLDRPGRSRRLVAALDAAWRAMADDYGLIPELPIDAVLARANRGEERETLPRMLQLLVGHELPVADAAAVAVRLGDHPWPSPELRLIEETLDAWWAETLLLEPGEHPEPYRPETVLGVLAGYDAPMVRWFDPWLAEMDGPGAVHLAAVVVAGPADLTADAWAAKDDQASQVFGWARTEAVLNGLVLVGGTHLDEGVLGQAIDRLI